MFKLVTIKSTTISISVLTLFFLFQPLLADEGNVVAENEGPLVWSSPTQVPEQFDWIQLTSGEWLKGELEVLYDGKLEFDSDELDYLKIDWEDVKEVRGHAVHSINFENAPTLVGNLQVVGDKVFVTAGGKRQEFRRDQVVSIAYGEDKERNYWTVRMALGLSMQSGNTESKDFDTNMTLQRRTSESLVRLDYFARLSETNKVKTEDSHRVDANYDLFVSKAFFWRPVFGEYFQDRFQNIAYRVSVGSGIGYYLINTPKTEWNIVGGPTYLETKFDTVESGENLKESSMAFELHTNLDTELSQSVDFIASYKIQVANEASGNYTQHAVTTVRTEITKWLDFDVTFMWDRVDKPTADTNGVLPEKDDYHFIVGLAVDF